MNNECRPEDREIYEIDWHFMSIDNPKSPDDFLVYFTVKGNSTPLGARGLIMDKLRGIEGKHYVKDDVNDTPR